MKEFREYLKQIQSKLNSGHATEHTYRPALKTLLESLEPGIEAPNEPRRIECGTPDFFVSQKGVPLGYVETKDIEVPLGLEKAGIENFRWHDLRHTFATRLIHAGVDLYTVQRLGH